MTKRLAIIIIVGATSTCLQLLARLNQPQSQSHWLPHDQVERPFE